jgi:glycosyltransferase involved in cell wall biosynthesis
MLTEDLLALGHRLTLAVDDRDRKASRTLEREHGGLLRRVAVKNCYDARGKLLGGSVIRSLEALAEDIRPDEVFACTLDEFASSLFRRASFGLKPPARLWGRLSGIYVRPRVLVPGRGINYRLKKGGFSRLSHNGFFKHVFLLDEFIAREYSKGFGQTSIHFLTDPWSGDFSSDRNQARAKMGIDEEKIVLLHYGLGTRRKGLHHLVRAVESTKNSRLLLLCAGRLEDDRDLQRRLKRLENRGRALLLNRFVTQEEEVRCFLAADWVMLPYVSHFGSSNVLARAAAAGVPVIASDFDLLGRRVKEGRLGLLVENDDARSLAECLKEIMAGGHPPAEAFRARLAAYAERTDRASFRACLEKVYGA